MQKRIISLILAAVIFVGIIGILPTFAAELTETAEIATAADATVARVSTSDQTSPNTYYNETISGSGVYAAPENGQLILNDRTIHAATVAAIATTAVLRVISRDGLDRGEAQAFRWTPDDTPKHTIVIHHTYPIRLGATAQQVETSQINAGFWGVAYNYLIDADGLITPGRPLFTRGAHDSRRRYGTVGIALIGAFNYEDPTQEQLDSLLYLIDDLQDRFPGIENIVPHWGGTNGACPGPWFVEFSQEQGWSEETINN